MTKKGIVNVRMVITEEKILSNIDKVQKLIDPNSKKQIIELDENTYFKDLVESIKTYIIEYPKKKNFPRNVYKSVYDLIEYSANELETNTQKINDLIKQRENNIKLSQILSQTLQIVESNDPSWKYQVRNIQNMFSKQVIQSLSLVAVRPKDSEEYISSLKLLNTRISNLKTNLFIEIDMERVEDRSKALSFIGLELSESLKTIPVEIKNEAMSLPNTINVAAEEKVEAKAPVQTNVYVQNNQPAVNTAYIPKAIPVMPQVAYAKSDIPISIKPTFINNQVNNQPMVKNNVQNVNNRVQLNQQQVAQRPITQNVNQNLQQKVTFPVGNNAVNNQNSRPVVNPVNPNMPRVNQQFNNVAQMQVKPMVNNQAYNQNFANRSIMNQNNVRQTVTMQNTVSTYDAQQDYKNRVNKINPFNAVKTQNQFTKAEDAANIFDTEQVIYDNGVEEKKVDRAYQNYYAESRRENKQSLWQKFVNSKFIQSIKYLFRIKVVLQLPEGTADNKNNI